MQSERYLLRPSRIQIISDLGKAPCLFFFYNLCVYFTTATSDLPCGPQGGIGVRLYAAMPIGGSKTSYAASPDGVCLSVFFRPRWFHMGCLDELNDGIITMNDIFNRRFL